MADVTISQLPNASDTISPVLVPVSDGTQTYLLSARASLYNSGNGQLGVSSLTFKNVILKSNAKGECWIGAAESNILSNTTDYSIAAECNLWNVKIAPGVRDAGYKIGLAVQGYITNPDFKGTLNQNYGIWCRHGFYSNAVNGYTPTGTIENSYGIYIESLSGTSGAKIQNCWGIYQPDNYGAKSKNYLEGDTGIGTSTPLDKLHVVGNVRANNTPKAYVNFDGSRTTTGGVAGNNVDVLIRSSYNVSRVRREGDGGKFTVYFSVPSPVTNENYVVNVAAGNTANTNILSQIGNFDFNPLFTTSSFRLSFHNGSTSVTPTHAHVVVHGT